MEINYNPTHNNYSSSAGKCKCGRSTILECGLCPTCCNVQYSLRSSLENISDSYTVQIASRGCGQLIYSEGDAPINCPDILCGHDGHLCYKCDPEVKNDSPTA